MTTGRKQEEQKRKYCEDRQTRRNGTYTGSASPLPHSLTEEEEVEEAAIALLMLSEVHDEPILLIGYRGECAASVSKEVENDIPTTSLPQRKPQVPAPTSTINYKIFKCKDCEKVFTSHQALGGHRSSHNKVKSDQINPSSENMAPMSIMPLAECPMQHSPMKESTSHICSDCNPEFSFGQAIGGHKRCHYIASKSGTAPPVPTFIEPISVAGPKLLIESSSTIVNLKQPHTFTFPQLFNNLDQHLDLNLSSPTDDHPETSLELDVPATMYVEPGFDIKKRMKMNNGAYLSHNYFEEETTSNQNLNDEDESKEVKFVELCNLRGMNVGEERSTWLQLAVGPIVD